MKGYLPIIVKYSPIRKLAIIPFEKSPDTFYKKLRAKLSEMKKWLYENRTMPVLELIKAMNRKLVGYYNYYGVSFNSKRLQTFLHFSQKYLYKVLNRRSHKRSYTSEQFMEFLKYCPLARPHVKVKLY